MSEKVKILPVWDLKIHPFPIILSDNIALAVFRTLSQKSMYRL